MWWYKAGSAFLLFCLLSGCTPGPRISPSNVINTGPQALQIGFPAHYKTRIGKGKLFGPTREAYARSSANLGAAPPQDLLFYARVMDAPDKTPYRAVGGLLPQLDTAQARQAGFVVRQIDNKPYLQREGVDRTHKTVVSEYLLKQDNGYFYLFSYAPIGHLLPNEEDVILAQDSLRSKYAGLVVPNLRADR
jgi:hypothetical protein